MHRTHLHQELFDAPQGQVQEVVGPDGAFPHGGSQVAGRGVLDAVGVPGDYPQAPLPVLLAQENGKLCLACAFAYLLKAGMEIGNARQPDGRAVVASPVMWGTSAAAFEAESQAN